MPVVARLDWISRQMAMQRQVHIHVGQARDADKVKYRIILEPPQSQMGALEAPTMRILQSWIASIRRHVQRGSAMDRGHRHTSGRSVVDIWARDVNEQTGDSARASLAAVHVTDSDNVPELPGRAPHSASSAHASTPAVVVVAREEVPAEAPADALQNAARLLPALSIGAMLQAPSALLQNDALDFVPGQTAHLARRHQLPRPLYWMHMKRGGICYHSRSTGCIGKNGCCTLGIQLLK